MSKHEDPMIFEYWNKMGGTLCKDFKIIEGDETSGPRTLDAVILPDGPKNQVYWRDISLRDQRTVIIQAKAKRLSMYLMGQTLFSAEIVKRFSNPRSIRSIALCKEDDPILGPLLIDVSKKVGVDMEIVTDPNADTSPMSESPGPGGTQMIKWYRDRVGGTLYRKFPKNVANGQHFIHATIVRDKHKSKKDILGKDIPKEQDVIVVHAKSKRPNKRYRLGMYLMGQALFGAELVKQNFKPRSIRSVVLCDREDFILSPMLEDMGKKIGIDMEAVVVPQDVNAQSKK